TSTPDKPSCYLPDPPPILARYSGASSRDDTRPRRKVLERPLISSSGLAIYHGQRRQLQHRDRWNDSGWSDHNFVPRADSRPPYRVAAVGHLHLDLWREA